MGDAILVQQMGSSGSSVIKLTHETVGSVTSKAYELEESFSALVYISTGYSNGSVYTTLWINEVITADGEYTLVPYGGVGGSRSMGTLTINGTSLYQSASQVGNYWVYIGKIFIVYIPA